VSRGVGRTVTGSCNHSNQCCLYTCAGCLHTSVHEPCVVLAAASRQATPLSAETPERNGLSDRPATPRKAYENRPIHSLPILSSLRQQSVIRSLQPMLYTHCMSVCLSVCTRDMRYLLALHPRSYHALKDHHDTMLQPTLRPLAGTECRGQPQRHIARRMGGKATHSFDSYVILHHYTRYALHHSLCPLPRPPSVMTPGRNAFLS